ncbi:GNAT family N-acetyltransferase [Salinicoccus sp. HZC-1]|uniref:GNAT family N-acetyltransferase n=1 Tax=Salinicoccus sp. HZC-1 TaxID=3385497 RepID=UPI00398B3794
MNNDIYFTREYAQVNELIESGESLYFEVKSRHGHITLSTIKREIGTRIDGEQYYDLISPYGYGGPVIHSYTNKEKLLAEFEAVFTHYCKRNNIVSEFVRFNPLFQNQEPFREIYDVSYLRNTVGTDLKCSEDTFQSEFCTTARRKVRKLLRDGRFSCELTTGFDNIEAFIDIYNDTMMRHNATGFYYFDREYFYEMKRKFPNNLFTTSVYHEGEIIAMGLYFISGNIIHDHLNGTKAKYLNYSPAYLLKYTAMNWGKENGFSVIHYGGGVSNSDEDSVLKFKKRFSNNTEFKFHIGKKIWNQSVYDKLCRIKDVMGDTEFFPAYRAGDGQKKKVAV